MNFKINISELIREVLRIMKDSRIEYMTEWYYSNPDTMWQHWNHSWLGQIHMWYKLRYVSDMIDGSLWEYLTLHAPYPLRNEIEKINNGLATVRKKEKK